jgi:hypothetical protein
MNSITKLAVAALLAFASSVQADEIHAVSIPLKAYLDDHATGQDRT